MNKAMRMANAGGFLKKRLNKASAIKDLSGGPGEGIVESGQMSQEDFSNTHQQGLAPEISGSAALGAAGIGSAVLGANSAAGGVAKGALAGAKLGPAGALVGGALGGIVGGIKAKKAAKKERKRLEAESIRNVGNIENQKQARIAAALGNIGASISRSLNR